VNDGVRSVGRERDYLEMDASLLSSIHFTTSLQNLSHPSSDKTDSSNYGLISGVDNLEDSSSSEEEEEDEEEYWSRIVICLRICILTLQLPDPTPLLNSFPDNTTTT